MTDCADATGPTTGRPMKSNSVTCVSDAERPDDHADTAQEYGEFPLRGFLGMELTDDAAGVGVATISIGPNHLNPNGVVHGAVLFALIDTAMGKSTMSVIDELDTFCASIEVSLRFIRPAVAGQLTATATVVKRGRNVVHLDGRISGDGEQLIATAAGTFAIIRN